MENVQPPEKRSTSRYIDIHSIFSTIQGEGPFTGRRAIFIRLAGCNLQCPGCDTDYTTGRRELHVSDILDAVVELAQPPYLVVITGGEPFRQPGLTDLCNTLVNVGYLVQIETNGSFAPEEKLSSDVTIVCSPKTGSVNKRLAQRADAFKYVLNANSVDPEDGLPIYALDHSATPRVARPPENFEGPIYVQPMDCKNTFENTRNMQAAVASCIEHGYTLQLQIHKIVGVE